MSKLFKKLRGRLPRERTPEELDQHFREIEKVGLEKDDIKAMFIAAFFSLILPLAAIALAFYGILYVLFAL